MNLRLLFPLSYHTVRNLFIVFFKQHVFKTRGKSKQKIKRLEVCQQWNDGYDIVTLTLTYLR